MDYKLGIGIVVVVALLAVPLVLGAVSGESLESRLDGWEAVTRAVPTEDKVADVEAMLPYIQPSAARLAFCENLREQWKESGSRYFDSSIDKISYGEDGQSALVWYGIASVQNGESVASTQMVPWVKVDGAWYRSITPIIKMPKFEPMPLPTFPSPFTPQAMPQIPRRPE